MSSSDPTQQQRTSSPVDSETLTSTADNPTMSSSDPTQQRTSSSIEAGTSINPADNAISSSIDSSQQCTSSLGEAVTSTNLANNATTSSNDPTQQGTSSLGEDKVSKNNVCRFLIGPFQKETPVLWFVQADTFFALNRMFMNETKFRFVITFLNITSNVRVSDSVIAMPAENKYEALKEKLISIFEDPNVLKFRRLLRHNKFVDEKPSNILKELRDLAADQYDDTVLRTVFLEKLPDWIKGIVAKSEVNDLSKLALQADKIVEESTFDIKPNEFERFANALCHICTNFFQLCGSTRQTNENGLCYYHKKFQEKAKKCQEPCSWVKKKSTPQTNENGLCYYHNKFQEKAQKCEEPCSWVKNKSGK